MPYTARPPNKDVTIHQILLGVKMRLAQRGRKYESYETILRRLVEQYIKYHPNEFFRVPQ